MIKKVEKFVNNYNISEKSLMIAFSGGYDSTVLIDILLNLRNKLNFKLFACHVNHNWRGEEGDREEQFCKEFCKNNNIAFFSKKLPENYAKNELEARNARYEFFKEIYDKNDIDYLLTAHTKSDNAETIIFRLAKGMGIQGLKGILPNIELNGMQVLRPLIDCTRCEIEEYIKDNNLKANFDSSNKNKKYKRNKVRLDIVPHFKELNENFEDSILNTSKIANFYDKSMDYFLDKTEIFKQNNIQTDIFNKLPSEVQQIVLYKFLSIHNIEMNFKQIQLLSKEINSNIPKSGKYFSLNSNSFILIGQNLIEIVEKKDDNISEYNFEISEVTENVKKFPNGTKNYIYADKSAIKQPLKLRTRLDGDVFQPFGMQGKMKLKKFLNDKAIPKFERDNLILLTNSDNEILWIYPLATSELVKVKDKNFVRIDLKNVKNNK